VKDDFTGWVKEGEVGHCFSYSYLGEVFTRLHRSKSAVGPTTRHPPTFLPISAPIIRQIGISRLRWRRDWDLLVWLLFSGRSMYNILSIPLLHKAAGIEHGMELIRF
jgi:hypothetical protein